MDDELVKALRSLLGEERVFIEKSDLVPYCFDYFGKESYEDPGIWPLCVVLPKTTEEVVGIVKLAVKNNTPIVPRGGGSNQVGGVMPIDGGIVLSTAKMNRVVDIDPINLTVTAQPGVGLREMDDILEPHGLILAQEQGSYKTANIGGAVSTNGISARSNRYRDIGDNVLSLEVVLGDGRVLRTGKQVCSHSSGYKLHKLFIAAEGTLGIITELTLQIMPKPESETAIGAEFDSWPHLEEVTLKMLRSGVNYAGGDSVTTRMEDGAIKHIMILGLEGIKEEVESQERILKRMLVEDGGKLMDHEKAWDLWRNVRKYWCGVPHPELDENDLVVALPLQHYDTVHEKFEKEIFPKYGLFMNEVDYKVIIISRRHLVVFSFFYDSAKTSPKQLKEAFGEMIQVVSQYGGSGAGCHAVGTLLRDHLPLEYDEVAIEVMRQLKRLFDPHNILNPDKKIP